MATTIINMTILIDDTINTGPAAPLLGAAAQPGGHGAAATESIIDQFAYPVLTEEVGYPPSPLAAPSTTPITGTAGAGLGQTALKAVSDVLGWKPKANDIAGFLGALNQSFTLTDVEGHVESKWTPRTYAVQTDLAGGVSGAQASIYARANDAVNQSLPLLDGLYSLDTEADPQVVNSVKAVIRNQMTELVSELAWPGGPRVTRVNQIFLLLIAGGATSFASFPRISPPQAPLGVGALETEPDNIAGQLGQLRDTMGLWSVVVANQPGAGNPYPLVPPRPPSSILINTVEEEQNVTNYRLIVDYITSLYQSWLNTQQFFGLQTLTPFFGTQLVLLSRQMSVVHDAVDEVRFTMDSVFITPSERQTLEIDFPSSITLPARPGRPANTTLNTINSQPLFAEDLLSWVQRFAAEEGPGLVQNGGKYGVGNTVLPIVITLRNLAFGAIHPTNLADLPRGYRTPRVHRALRDLATQLDELAIMCSPLSFTVPPQE
jgi:hypothetical protein